MLTNTFCHIPNIGSKTEEYLWEEGITSWEICLNTKLPNKLQSKEKYLKNHIEESLRALEKRNVEYFSHNLKHSLLWRLIPEFKDELIYIDIETTGLYKETNLITTIVTYDGKTISYFVRDRNFDQIINVFDNNKIIVSYNGIAFDIPFIEHAFNLKLQNIHIDLRYLFKSIGLTGGLKKCEKSIGIHRQDLEGVDGQFAVYLWKFYKKKINSIKSNLALETLLSYNIQDTINLPILLEYVYNQNLPSYFKNNTLKFEDPPENPFKPDLKTIKRIRKRYYRF
jgi:uncharacterized protein YprB with RNaseH-like and TPR domain